MNVLNRKPMSRDYYKLIAIAKTFYYLRGEFSNRMLYDFLIKHKFSFDKDMTKKRVGVYLGKCSTIERTKRVNKVSWYKVIE